MPNKSAGILPVRFRKFIPEVLLVHSGGPFWANRDMGAMSIPKAEFEVNENPLDAAKGELAEEKGIVVKRNFIKFTKEKNGVKLIYVRAFQKDLNTATIHRNNFELEGPPKSGKKNVSTNR